MNGSGREAWVMWGCRAAGMSFPATGFTPSVHCHCHCLHPGEGEGCFPEDCLPGVPGPSEGMEGQEGDNRLQRAAPAGCQRGGSGRGCVLPSREVLEDKEQGPGLAR